MRWGHIDENPAKLAGPNPQPKRLEIIPFTHAEIEKLAVELGPWGPLIIFACDTGLRPSEWIALEHGDVSRAERVLVVVRSFSHGSLKRYGKTTRSRRRVPLSSRALWTLDEMPRRLNTPLVFPARGGGNCVKAGHGGYFDLSNFRRRDWHPALESAGIPQRRIYDLRHTFATNALAAGLNIFELSRYMGTSVAMIDRTYGHLACGAEADAGRKLDDLASRSRVNSERLGAD